MDFSEKYIKMCAEAEEIQRELFCGHYDDYVYIECGEKDIMFSGVFIFDFCKKFRNIQKIVMLPRQDQLQQMLSPFYVDENGKVDWREMYEDLFYHLPILIEIDTPEQAWLHLVMKVKYNKIWDDKKEKWVEMEGRDD